jgi:hypothetical protein
MPKTRSGFTLLKAPKAEGKSGPPPFEVPNKSLPYWLGKGAEVVTDDEQPEETPELDLKKLGAEELHALAVSRGLNPDNFKNKGELVAALES